MWQGFYIQILINLWQRQPDNWSFLEKFLNAVAFSGSDETVDSDQVRKEITDTIAKKLLDKLMKIHIAYPDSPIWKEYHDSQFNAGYENLLVQTAQFLCQQRFTIGGLKEVITKYFITVCSIKCIHIHSTLDSFFIWKGAWIKVELTSNCKFNSF